MNIKSDFRTGRHSIVLTLGLIVLVASGSLASHKTVKPVESTTAYQLLEIESSVRSVPEGARKLLMAVIDDATRAALRVRRKEPATRDEALKVMEAIQISLVRHNFLQPARREDWPQTIGIALTPLTLSSEALSELLSTLANAKRANYIDRGKPFYFVDCDMGAQLFIAVGERLDWDIRLVEVPDHNFVRWHLSSGTTANWDWTQGMSVEDSDYIPPTPFFDSLRLRGVYLRSFGPREARAYYLGLIGSKATQKNERLRLLTEAIVDGPMQLATQNNLAWFYATNPEYSNQKDVAVAYALASWSARPEDGNVADTVACSFAANGNQALAISLEDYAISHAISDAQRESFSANRSRIIDGESCQ